MNKKWIKLLLAVVTSLSLLAAGCDAGSQIEIDNSASTTVESTGEDAQTDSGSQIETDNGSSDTGGISEDGEYSSKEEVALYLYSFGKLPPNYITKKEAEALGWQSNKGNLWAVAPGMSIGGDSFGNREGLLPKANKRKYFECDIDYEGGYRNEKRIVFSDDGLIFYTGDHYNSFEQLY